MTAAQHVAGPARTTGRLGVLTLALGAFGIGLTEFAPAGLLPAIGTEFAVSDGTSGWTVGAYAIAVAIGAVVMSLLAAGRDRGVTLRLLVAIFVIGNLVTALAPSFPILLTGRVIAALCHGAYMGIAAATAAAMMPSERRASAVAIVFSGITLAIVLGLPVGTFLGNHFGWRTTFAVMTGLGLLVLLALFLFVPAGGADRQDLRSELAWLGNGQVWLTLVVSTLGFGGVFGAFSYLAFTLTDTTGLGAGAVTVLLFGFGVGTFVGNLAGGSRWATRLGDRFLIASPVLVAVVMLVFALTAGSVVGATVGVLLMGAVGFSLTPRTQARILAYAEGAAFASSANIAALNLGNWIGATLSGVAIDAGWGTTAPLFVGAGLSLLAALVMLRARALASRR